MSNSVGKSVSAETTSTFKWPRWEIPLLINSQDFLERIQKISPLHVGSFQRIYLKMQYFHDTTRHHDHLCPPLNHKRREGRHIAGVLPSGDKHRVSRLINTCGMNGQMDGEYKHVGKNREWKWGMFYVNHPLCIPNLKCNVVWHPMLLKFLM